MCGKGVSLPTPSKTKKIDSYLVNNKQELKKEWFLNKNKIAITAGTSSPQDKISEVIQEIKSYNL